MGGIKGGPPTPVGAPTQVMTLTGKPEPAAKAPPTVFEPTPAPEPSTGSSTPDSTPTDDRPTPLEEWDCVVLDVSLEKICTVRIIGDRAGNTVQIPAETSTTPSINDRARVRRYDGGRCVIAAVLG